MEELILVEPTKQLEPLLLAYKNEYIAHGETHINGSCSFMRYTDYDEWLNKVQSLTKIELTDGSVPATTYFLLRQSDNKIVGSIQLRHQLNDYLRASGGHIGYSICPTERRKGYATWQLRQVLKIAQQMNIPKVMITCDKSNAASAKTAVKCGGVLTWEGYCEKEIIQVYWIDLF